ncbi:MAG: hypothetical protein V3S46_03005 [Nitrospinota bacterium]
MNKEEFLDFIDNFDFDALMEAFTSGEWKWVFYWWPVWVVGAVLLILIGVPKSRDLGTLIATWGAVALVYFVGIVVLRNSDISTPGPFVIAATLAFGAAGYFVYTTLFKR